MSEEPGKEFATSVAIEQEKDGSANELETGPQHRLVVRKKQHLRGSLPYAADPNYRRLSIMTVLTTAYFFVELVWGLAIGSLALVADSMHMLSDLLGMLFGIYALRLSKRPPTETATYGWLRIEVIGGLVNGAFLVGISFLIFLESITRFFEPEPEQLQNSGTTLLIIGSVGFVVNVIGLVVLSSDHSHGHSHDSGSGSGDDHHSSEDHTEHMNLNIYAVLIHVAGDAVGSISVIITGVVITVSKSDKRVLADPICSMIISALICLTAVPLIRRCTSVLLQHAPSRIDVGKIEAALRKIPGVLDLHELHVWQLTPERVIGSVHVLFGQQAPSKTVDQIKLALHAHGVHATTIQPEVYTGMVTPNVFSESFPCHEPICNAQCTTKACCAAEMVAGPAAK